MLLLDIQIFNSELLLSPMEDELLDEDSSELDEISDEDELPLAIIIALSSAVKNSTSFMSEQEMNANASTMPAASVIL
jgi:hypothetical protein